MVRCTILTPRGQSEIQRRYKDKLFNLLFQVVEDPLVPLLSAEACEQLRLLQINFAMCDNNIILKFPDVFKGLIFYLDLTRLQLIILCLLLNMRQ